MKKVFKIIFTIVGSICIAFTAMYFLVESRTFPRMETARVRIAAEREKVRRTVQVDTIWSYSLTARRGDILDCKSRIIATAATVYDIHFDATLGDDEQWNSNISLLSDSLAIILNEKSAGEYYSLFSKSRLEKKRYVRLCKGVDSLSFARLRQLPLFNTHPALNGIIIEPIQVRQYPFGALARRTIGFVRSGYSEYLNNIGIEGRYDNTLSGEDGYKVVRSKWIKWPLRPAKQKVRKTTVQQRNGEDIRLTLDIEMQAKADSILRDGIEDNPEIEGACLVLADVKSGAIRSMVNLVRDADGDFKEYYNVAIGRPYEPGSLLSPAIDISARKCGSDGFSVDAIYGKEQSFVDTLINVVGGGSWNRDSWDILGISKIKSVAPSDPYWSTTTLESLGKGYSIQAPSLDYLALYTAIARGGDGVRLHLVERDSVECYQLCTKEQSILLKQSLSEALRQDTAFKSTNVSIAGRTGHSFIAQANGGYVSNDGKKAVQSSFAGFFPYDEPEFSIICMVYTKPSFKSVSAMGISSWIVAELVNELYEKN